MKTFFHSAPIVEEPPLIQTALRQTGRSARIMQLAGASGESQVAFLTKPDIKALRKAGLLK